MTPADLASARRAVACRGWRWMPGMRVGAPHRLGIGDPPWEWTRLGAHDEASGTVIEQVTRIALPDLSDPATKGCLLALVRKAWGASFAYPWPDKSGTHWWVYLRTQQRLNKAIGNGPTETEALVAALEAAPEQA